MMHENKTPRRPPARLKLQTLGILGSAFLQSALGFSAPQKDSHPSVLVISGAANQNENFVRYENNVRLLTEVLSESGTPAKNVTTLFSDGKSSQVRLDIFEDERRAVYRPNGISSLISGPATLSNILDHFDSIVLEKKRSKASSKNVILFSTDHGTPNASHPEQGYISLVHGDRLTIQDEENFSQRLLPTGSKLALIGNQCFSGANMQVAMHEPNACAFASAAPDEVAYGMVQKDFPQSVKIDAQGSSPFDEYTYYFLCALHSQYAGKNTGAPTPVAAISCPNGIDADFNHDGKISLAEAHFYALSQIAPHAVPEISSQFFAKALLEKKLSRSGQALSAAEIESVCKTNPDDLLRSITAGGAFQAALRARIGERLSAEKTLIGKLLAGTGKTFEDQVSNLEKYQQAYETQETEIRSGNTQLLAQLEDLRKQSEAYRAKLREQLLSSTGDPSLRKLNEELQALKTRLMSRLDTPEKHRTEDRYNVVGATLSSAISKKMDQDPTFSAALKSFDAQEDLINKKVTKLQNLDIALKLAYANVRRAHALVEGYSAELEVLKSGSNEDRAKLAQLYSCEDQTLD